MKLYLFLILIILFSTLFTRKSNRKVSTTLGKSKTNNLVKAKTFALKSYTCGIIIDGKESGKGTFFVESLSHPKGDENLGWMFQFEKQPSSEIRKLFVPKYKNYYLPYRNISHDILYVNPFGSPKRFEVTITDDTGKIHYIKINLPYAEKNTFINDEEANTLRGLLNILRVKIQDMGNNYKKSASVQASNYINVTPLLKAANAGEEAFKGAVTTSQHESDALAIIIKSDEDKYNETKAEYDKVEKEYTELRNKLASLNERISESKNLRMAKEFAAKEYKDKKPEDLKKDLQKNQKKYLSSFEAAMAKLTSVTPSQSAIVQDARKDILNKLDLGKFTEKVSHVYSGN